MTARFAGTAWRWCFGWILAAVWLGYLEAPLRAMLDHGAGYERDLGLVGLVGFVLAYLVSVAEGRRARHTGRYRALPLRWLQLGVLIAMAVLMVPAAGDHALTAAVYVAVAAMVNLPPREGLGTAAVIFIATEVLTRVVPGWRDGGYGLSVLLGTAAVLGIQLAFERNQRLVQAQAELGRMAVQNERARIAADLHDILGHSLTVVAVKAELAQRLLDLDPERARTELRELEILSRDALADVRATALGVRGVSLGAEIAAAREALAAAAIKADLPVAVDEVPTAWRELFAWTVREAVTNVVRHSRAGRCEIHLKPDSVEILDDGVGSSRTDGGGQGIAGLRRRAQSLDAELSVGNRTDGPGFRVAVRAPR